MSRDLTRFCVSVDEQPRELFSVQETNNKGLILSVRSAEGFGRSGDGLRNTQHKFTIHPSIKSDTYNLIHLTRIAHDSTRLEHWLMTDAVKKNTGFAHIYFRRCPDLKRGRYIPSDSDRSSTSLVNVGVYDPGSTTMVHSVLVGSSEVTFNPPSGSQIGMVQRVFGKFSIVVLNSCWLAQHSHETGMYMYLSSAGPEKVESETEETKALVRELMNGRPATECLNEFQFAAWTLMAQFYEQTFSDFPQEKKVREHAQMVELRKLLNVRIKSFAGKIRPALAQLFLDRSQWPPTS